MASPETIKLVLAEIASLYPQLFHPEEGHASVWARYLRDLPDELLVNALRHYVATAPDNYPPSVPALRRAASDLKRLAAGVPTAYEAWQNLLAVGDGSQRPCLTGEYHEDGGSVIAYVAVPFCHPLVEQVARQLGWPKFPNPASLETDRAHFLKAYEAAVNKLTDRDRELPEVKAFVERARVDAQAVPKLKVFDQFDARPDKEKGAEMAGRQR
jgi:hypothetical protein